MLVIFNGKAIIYLEESFKQTYNITSLKNLVLMPFRSYQIQLLQLLNSIIIMTTNRFNPQNFHNILKDPRTLHKGHLLKLIRILVNGSLISKNIESS